MSRVLYLIRHGRSDFGSVEMSPTARGDQWDPPLSEEGRRQAQALAARLRLMELDRVIVYCSPLRRTLETVAPWADAADGQRAIPPSARRLVTTSAAEHVIGWRMPMRASQGRVA